MFLVIHIIANFGVLTETVALFTEKSLKSGRMLIIYHFKNIKQP